MNCGAYGNDSFFTVNSNATNGAHFFSLVVGKNMNKLLTLCIGSFNLYAAHRSQSRGGSGGRRRHAYFM